jgi:hypothetical protein
MDANPHSEILRRTLRKLLAALQGLGRKPVVIGALAHQAWGAKLEPKAIDLLIPAGVEHREAIFSAARGEGLQQPPDHPILSLPETVMLRVQYTDPKLAATAEAGLLEAATPFLKQVHGRAQPGGVLDVQVTLATCEDLILLRAGSDLPADRASVVELLRCTAGRMDAQYLRQEAEKAGAFDKLKSAWKEAKQGS